ncbi:MAG: stalk domain-containing protein [Bacillota bacterium]
MRLRMKLVGLLLSVSLLGAAMPASSAEPAPLSLYVNGRELFMPTPPVIRESRVLVPMRAYLEALGATVDWQPPDTVTARMKGRSVQLKIGSTTALVDGQPHQLDVPAQLIEDRTYLPLRFLSEGLGAQVDYDGKSVRVTNGGPPSLIVFDGPLNVRLGPSTLTTVLTTVPTGTVLEVIRQEGSWTLVRLPRGASGWVANQFTRPVQAKPLVEPFEPLLAQAEGFVQVGSRCLGASPVINDRLHVPLKQTVEGLGGQVTTLGNLVEVRLGGHRVMLIPGERAAARNGQPITLGTPPVVVGGQVLMGARDLADSLGLPLGWSDQLRTASLGVAGPQPVCNPQLSSRAYLIMDAATGAVLSEYRSRVRLPIASTTKIMTALLAVERGNPNSLVTVSVNAANQPGTSVYLRAGEKRTLRELLFGLMLVSGNDAATAIAEHLSGSEAAFARLMTQRATELGAHDTLFLTASGLDDWINPYSTARDLAVITRHALKHPEFRIYMSQAEQRIPGPSGTRLLKNRNDFVVKYPGATGVKNGWTEKANHTLVASAFRGDQELIVVLLGAPSRTALYKEAAVLMDHGFRLAEQSWLLRPDP